ncbi:protein SCAF11 [Hyperolius riggenbachi]|uniref:protein SCAF11 n=1 Tax=Hyperolius riggenbachi TaxID=752182 RepID=UPI0035A387FC
MKSKRLCLSGSRDQQHEETDGEESNDDRCSGPVALSLSESCPICLNSLPAEVGFPEYCCHAFCLSCILKWSETSTSCPVDRKPFKTIYKLNPDGGCTKINVVARSPRENVCCSCNLCQWCCIKSKIHFRVDVKKETSENTDNCPTKGCKNTEDKYELELRNPGWENLCFLGGSGDDILVQSEMTPLNSTEIEDANELCLIQRKREGLKHVRLPTVLQRIEGHASLSVESVICMPPSLDEYIFPLRPLSIRNKDFPKRTCVHSRAQDGTEKKQAASSSKGSRKKNVQPSTRRRSTRNSRSDVSPLQSSPKSSNSDNDAAGRNNSSSSTNAPSSSEKHRKPSAKQRKRAPKKSAQTRKRLRSAAQTQEESNESRENSDSETEQESKKAKVTDDLSDTAPCEVKLSDAVSTEKESEQEDSFLALSPVGQSTDEPIPDSPPVLSVENIDEDTSASLDLQNTPPSPSFTNGQMSLEKSDPTSKSGGEIDSDVLDTEQHLSTEEDCLQSDNMQDSEGECQGSPASVKSSNNACSPSSPASENESLTNEKPLTPSASPEDISDFKEPSFSDIGQAEAQSSESLNKNQLMSLSPSKSENVVDSEDETKVKESLNSPAVDLEKRFSSEHSPGSCDSFKENASETDDLPKVQSVESPMRDSSSESDGCDDKLNGLEVSLQEPGLTDTKTCSSVESEHICSTDISANKTQLPEETTVKEFGDSAEVQATTLCSDNKDLPLGGNRTESFPDLSIIEEGSKMSGSEKVSDPQSEKQVAFSEDNNESVAMECDSVCSDRETETELPTEKTEDSLEEPSSSASAKDDDDEPSSSIPAKDDKSSSSISKKEDEPSSSVSAKQESESTQKPPVPPGEEASKKEPRPRRSRFHSPSTTWSPSKNDIKERQKSRSRSRSKNRDPPSPSKPKSRSRSREKDRNHSEQWKGRSRDRHHRRQSRSKSRSRSRSGSRTTNRSRTNTVEKTDKGSPPWRERRPNDNWKSPRGTERPRRNEPEKPNEHFRTDKYDSRVSSEPYMENKNDYPDWVAERIRSTESRGREDGWMRGDGRGRGWGDNRGRGDGRGRGENWTRGDYRGRGDFRGRGDRGRGEGRGGRGGNRGRGSPRSSHWEDNQFNSGDSWSRNVNMDWNSPRGRGSRGRGGFRGGFNYGDQHENTWNNRQPYSGNSNTSGPESTRPQEHKSYKPKFEETFESPVDRSGWTSASSWAVRKTLPADVQNYYSKRGRNSTGNQPGWNRPEASQDQDQALKDQPSQQTENAQMPVNIVQPPMNVAPPQPMNPPPQPMNPPPQPMNPPPQTVNIYPYNVGVPPPIVNIHHNPYNIHPQLPMHLHPAMPLVQVSAPPSNVPQGLPPPPPPPPPSQQVSYVVPQQEVKPLPANPIVSHVNTTSSAPPPLPAPPVTQGVMGTSMARSPVSVTISSQFRNPHISVKPSPWREPITVEASADSSKKEKKFLIQERAALEVKGAIKPYYQNKDITKDEYKEIVKKAVDKVCHSKSGEVDSAKVANLVKAYVDKYKHSRKKGPDDRL